MKTRNSLVRFLSLTVLIAGALAAFACGNGGTTDADHGSDASADQVIVADSGNPDVAPTDAVVPDSGSDAPTTSSDLPPGQAYVPASSACYHNLAFARWSVPSGLVEISSVTDPPAMVTINSSIAPPSDLHSVIWTLSQTTIGGVTLDVMFKNFGNMATETHCLAFLVQQDNTPWNATTGCNHQRAVCYAPGVDPRTATSVAGAIAMGTATGGVTDVMDSDWHDNL